jgi:hypothetical protein
MCEVLLSKYFAVFATNQRPPPVTQVTCKNWQYLHSLLIEYIGSSDGGGRLNSILSIEQST